MRADGSNQRRLARRAFGFTPIWSPDGARIAFDCNGGLCTISTEMMQGTPAAQCGMKEGDVLLQLGQKKICQPEDVFDASFYITAGEMVPITVMRGGKQLTFHVQAELHPVSKNVPMLSDGTRVPTAADANRSTPLRLESAVQHTP